MRSFVCRIVSLVLLASVAPVAAQTYPSRPITIVVGYPPGATSDLLARTVGEPLAAALGQPILIDNRAGAGGTVAAAYVARARGDGYTLLVGTDAMMTSNIYLYKNVAFDPVNDVSPITNAGANIIVLAVHADLPVKSVAELVAYAKANPGKLQFGSSGLASPHHLAGELLKLKTGIDIVHVPYRGGALSANDLAGGHIGMAFLSYSAVAGLIPTGKIRILAVVEKTRYAALPDVPTVAETVPGYEASVSFGLFATTGTPADIVRKVNADVQQIVRDPDFRTKYLERFAVEPVPGPLDAFSAYLRKESAMWGDVIKKANVKVE